jgi:hypothetical protein
MMLLTLTPGEHRITAVAPSALVRGGLARQSWRIRLANPRYGLSKG